MKKIKQILSFVVALAMIVGIALPGFAAKGDKLPTGVTSTVDEQQISATKPEKTTVNIFKLGGNSYKAKAPWDHNGGTIKPEDYSKLGDEVKALEGVKFTIYKIKYTPNDENSKDEAYKYLEQLKKNPSNYDTKDKMAGQVTGDKVELVKETSATGVDGKVSEELGEGLYWVIESETPKSPKTVSSAIAVPFALTLPVTLSEDAGSHKAGKAWLKTLNVYPKNILSGKPQMDKNFTTKEDGSKVENSKKTGADYDNYNNEKAQISKKIGDKVDYEVKTKIPQNALYETLNWSDTMSQGLRFDNDSLKVTVKYKKDGGQEETNDNFNLPMGALTSKTNGFDLTLTVKDIEVNAGYKFSDAIKKGDVEFTLVYTATITADAVVDNELYNNITFIPGKPDPGKKVVPGDNGELIVKKKFEGENKADSITYYLVREGDAGETTVASVKLDSTSKGKTIDLGNGIKFVVDETDWYKGKFTGLDKDTTYRIKEFVDKYQPNYNGDAETADTKGEVNITNKYNPDIINPKPPIVYTGGRKFVKTDSNEGTNRLAGAEFIVKKKGKDEYLTIKTGNAKQEYEAAEAKYNEAINKYNEARAKDGVNDTNVSITIDGNTFTGKQLIENQIEEFKRVRDEKFKFAKEEYAWGSKEDAIKFTSDEQGRFEIVGVEYGEYELVEIKAPKGYAKLSEPVSFKIFKGSYRDFNTGISYDKENNKKDAINVINRKVDIPQTGGIGTIIFIVIGIALMGGAIFGLRRREEA